jgi:hypothetical protein
MDALRVNWRKGTQGGQSLLGIDRAKGVKKRAGDINVCLHLSPRATL